MGVKIHVISLIAIHFLYNIHNCIISTDEDPSLRIESPAIINLRGVSIKLNKTPAQAFTPPADEKKMGTIWIFVYYAVYGSGRDRCRVFLVLKWGGGS